MIEDAIWNLFSDLAHYFTNTEHMCYDMNNFWSLQFFRKLPPDKSTTLDVQKICWLGEHFHVTRILVGTLIFYLEYLLIKNYTT